MRRVFGITLLLALSSAISFASNATFSKDGQHVYFIDSETSDFFDIDIAKESASRIDIGSLIDNKPIIGIATTNSGDLLVATASAAWSYNVEKKSATRLCGAPEGVEFKEMAYDPKNGGILFSTRDESDLGEALHEGRKLDPNGIALFLERGASKPVPVYVRRVDYLQGIAFSPDSELFFGTHGDLWSGAIVPSNFRDVSKEAPRWVLGAARCAPLANLETSELTAEQIGVVGTAIAKNKLYVFLNRWGGGRTRGRILRLNHPHENSEETKDDLMDSLKLYASEISSLESLGYADQLSLCASSDGDRVLFINEQRKIYLVENNGKPRELKMKLPE